MGPPDLDLAIVELFVKLAFPEEGGWTLLVKPHGLREGARARLRQPIAQGDLAL